MNCSLDVGETGLTCVANWPAGSVLFDIDTDPHQESPVTRDDVKDRLVDLMAEQMSLHDAPKAIYTHYGLTNRQTT